MANVRGHRWWRIVIHHSTAPNFLIVGAARSGSTALAQWLSKHPQVFMPKIKEPHHFSQIPAPIGLQASESYSALFEAARGFKAVGEASTSYLPMYAETIPRIKSVLGDPKIIILLRDPIERFISHVRYYQMCGFEERDLLTVIDKVGSISSDPWQASFDVYSQCSLYSSALAAYKNNFSDVMVIPFEKLSLAGDLGEALADFLQLDTPVVREEGKPNSSGIARFPMLKPVVRPTVLTRGLARVLPRRMKETLKRSLLTEEAIDPRARATLKERFHPDLERLASQVPFSIAQWCE